MVNKGGFMAAHQDRDFMRYAIKVMRDVGVVKKSGGPFGAVIVKHGKVIAAAGNTVEIQSKSLIILRMD